MNKYQHAKIYKIVSPSTGLVYVGSTAQSLSKRMKEHRKCYKYWVKNKTNYTTSYKVLECGDAKILLIKDYPCNSKKELEKEEGEEMKKIDCVNTVVAGRSGKEYYKDNREKILKDRKEYHKNNREKILKDKKEYHKKNKEKMNKNSAEYYKDNREKILKQKGEKITCCCGSITRRSDKAKHERTLKHVDALRVFIDDNSFVYIF